MLLPLLSLALLQGNPFNPLGPDGFARDYALPAALTSVQVSRTLAGDWNGDLRTDAVLLAGDQICFQHGPDTFETNLALPSSLTGSVIDVESLPHLDGTLSLLCLVSGSVRVLHWDGTTQGFVLDNSYTANGWGGARSIQRVELGGSALPDYIGINATGRRVLVLRDFDGTTGTALSDIVVGADILSIAPVDWTGDGVDEVAVRLAGAVRVYPHTGGSALLAHTAARPTRLIQPVGCENEAGQRLAVLETDAVTLHDWLVLLGNGTTTTSLDVGNFGIHAMAAANLDNGPQLTADEDDDLVFAQDTTSDLLVLLNDSQASSATPFVITNMLVYPGVSATPAAGNVAQPLLADFDGDGDVDLLAAMPGGTLRMQRNPVISETKRWPHLSSLAEGAFLSFDEENPPPLLLLWILEPEEADFVPDGLQFTAWRQPDPDTLEVESSPVLAEIYDLDPGFVDGVFTLSEIPLPETEDDFVAVYYFSLRTVTRDGAGNITAASPTTTYFYTATVGTYDLYYEALENPMKLVGPKLEPLITQISPSRISMTGGGGPSGGPPMPAN